MGGHVFLSYCRDDRDYVDKLAAYLGESGVPVWFDDHLMPGERWLNALRRQIEEAEAVVVVMTPAAQQSDWVQIEIQQARDAGRPILPLLLDGEPFLSRSLDVRGRGLPGEAFLARLRSAPAAPPAGLPARIMEASLDLVRDVLDVRADCETAASVLGLLAQMLRVLRAGRADERATRGSAVLTINAVQAVLPRQYGRPGRARPARIDEGFATSYATAVAEVLTSIKGLDGTFPTYRSVARVVLRPGGRSPRSGAAGLERTSRAIEKAQVAARELAAAIYDVGVDVCGLDLSGLVVADIEYLDGFLWDSTTRWPRKLIDAVFERSISAGDGTMLIRRP